MAINILKLQDELKGLPDKTLIQYAQTPSGQVPQYLVLSELQRRKTMRDEYQQSQTQKPQSTVAQDLEQGLGQLQPAPEQEAVQMAEGGVTSIDIPDHMFQANNMASGGIIAFDDGGAVPDTQDIMDYLQPRVGGSESGFSASVAPYIDAIKGRVRAGVMGSTNPKKPISGYQIGYEDGVNAAMANIIPTPAGNIVGAEYRGQLGNDSELALRGNYNPYGSQRATEVRQAPLSIEYTKRFDSGGIVSFSKGGVPTLDELQNMTPEELQNLPDYIKRQIYLAQQAERKKLSPQAQQTLRDAGQLNALQQDQQGIEAVHPELYAIPAGRLGKSAYGAFMSKYFPAPVYGPEMAGKRWLLNPQRGFTGAAQDVAKLIGNNPRTSAAGATGLASLGALLGLSDDGPAAKPQMMFPDGTIPPANAPAVAPAGMTSEQALQTLNRNADILNQGIKSNKVAPTGAPTAPATGILTPTAPGTMPASDESIFTGAENFATKFLGPKPDDIDYEKAKQETIDRLKDFGFDPDVIKNQQADLEKSRKKLGDDKAFAINMRILEAGLGIASGSSPNAFVNLKGAIPALQELGQDINKINELDRSIDKEQRNLAVEQNKLAQGLASASEAKVDKAKDKLAEYYKTRGTIAANVFNNMNSNQVQMAGHLLQAKTSRENALLQAQVAREGHQAQRDVADIYANPKENKLTADVIAKINAISSSDEARKDSDTIAMEKLPIAAKNPMLAQKIADAKARQAERERLVQSLKSQLPPGMQTPTAPQAASGRVVTMAQVNAAAAKTGKSVEQVLADARSKGYIIQ